MNTNIYELQTGCTSGNGIIYTIGGEELDTWQDTEIWAIKRFIKKSDVIHTLESVWNILKTGFKVNLDQMELKFIMAQSCLEQDKELMKRISCLKYLITCTYEKNIWNVTTTSL